MVEEANALSEWAVACLCGTLRLENVRFMHLSKTLKSILFPYIVNIVMLDFQVYGILIFSAIDLVGYFKLEVICW